MDKIPKHIAIVMDGNGRWAKQRSLPRIAGHKIGVDRVREVVKICAKEGVQVLTLFAFSTENWERPTQEVGYLMRLFFNTIKKEVKELHKNNVQLRFIGDHSRLSKSIKEQIKQAEEFTALNTGLKLVIALSYSGRWDITQAIQKLGDEIENTRLKARAITEALIQKYICLGNLPEPDLFIRTSGEQRISNFMLWQLAYTELYFTDVLWPDFREPELVKALAAYANRERRFGLVKKKT